MFVSTSLKSSCSWSPRWLLFAIPLFTEGLYTFSQSRPGLWNHCKLPGATSSNDGRDGTSSHKMYLRQLPVGFATVSLNWNSVFAGFFYDLISYSHTTFRQKVFPEWHGTIISGTRMVYPQVQAANCTQAGNIHTLSTIDVSASQQYYLEFYSVSL